jgi:putative ABC transport system permease protein
MGLLSAVGFTPWGLRRLALGEGMGLATVGGLLGLPAAIAYTWIMMYGLRTWWNGAVGTTSLYLHVTMDALVYGLVASLFVAFLAILWAAWRVGKTAAATLLAGGWGAESSGRRSGRWLRVCGILLVLATLGIFAMAPYSHGDPQETFMGGGALLLCGCLCWLAGVLRPGIRRPLGAKGIATVGRLGIRRWADCICCIHVNCGCRLPTRRSGEHGRARLRGGRLPAHCHRRNPAPGRSEYPAGPPDPWHDRC